MSLPTETRSAQPRALTSSLQLVLLGGEVDSGQQELPDLRPPARCSRRRPACSTASSKSRSSTSRQPSTPRWCGELSGPADEREQTRPSAATSARSVFELPPSTARTIGAVMPPPVFPPPQQALDELRVERVLADQRMREQRLARDRGVARHGRLSRQPLVRGDVLRETEQLGRERRLRQRDEPAGLDARRHLDDVVVREAGERAVVTDVHLVHGAVAADERRDETGRGLAVERAAALLEQRRLLVQRRVAVELEQVALDLGDHLGARRARRAARRGSRRGGRSTGGTRTGRRRAPRAAATAAPPAPRSRRRATPSARGARRDRRRARPGSTSGG